MYVGTSIFQSGVAQMGAIATIDYDGNIFISPGLGTTDEEGQLIEERTHRAIEALVQLIEITCKYAMIF